MRWHRRQAFIRPSRRRRATDGARARIVTAFESPRTPLPPSAVNTDPLEEHGREAIRTAGTLDARPSNVSTAARDPGATPVLAHTKLGRSMLMSVAISYLIDGLLLTGFAFAGTISFAIPLAYTAVGLIECALTSHTQPEGAIALLRNLTS